MLSLNFSCKALVATALLRGSFHILHARQVSVMLAQRSVVLLGTPAARRSWTILSELACHHLRCSFRRVRLIEAGLPARNTRKAVLTSNDVQSSASPEVWVPPSASARRARC